MKVAQVVKSNQKAAQNLLYGTGIDRLSASSEDSYCVMSGVIPSGVSVPLHSHAEAESFYLLSGHAEALVQTEAGLQWQPLDPGDFIHIPSEVKHAWRNLSTEPAVTLIVCTARLGSALEEMELLAREYGTLHASPAALQRLLEICERYGYWLGSPEENAAVGINLTGGSLRHLFHGAQSEMANVNSGILLSADKGMPYMRGKQCDTTDMWFSRFHKTLHFIACRILADSRMAECAVENCRIKASRNLHEFEEDGAFGSWILRLLIHEALSILYPDRAEGIEIHGTCLALSGTAKIHGRPGSFAAPVLRPMTQAHTQARDCSR